MLRAVRPLLLLLAGLLGVLALRGRAFAAVSDRPATAAEARQDGQPKPQHVHQWTRQTRKEWVAPVTKQVQVGVDAHGKPVYQTQIVKPGYWRTVNFFVCACGAVRA
jgi:hypothetical protein